MDSYLCIVEGYCPVFFFTCNKDKDVRFNYDHARLIKRVEKYSLTSYALDAWPQNCLESLNTWQNSTVKFMGQKLLLFYLWVLFGFLNCKLDLYNRCGNFQIMFLRQFDTLYFSMTLFFLPKLLFFGPEVDHNILLLSF